MINSEQQEPVMKINTAKFGVMEIEKKDVINFESPIIGFDNSSKYALLPHAENSPFIWLQSLDEPEVAFVLIEAFNFFPDYAPDIDDRDLGELEVDSVEDLVLTLLVSIPKDYKKMTANLVAPIVINNKNRFAKQVIIKNSEKYNTKERIIKD